MTKSNKMISFILSILTLLSAFVLLSTAKVNAVSQTRDEAVSWANSQIAKYIDVDGAYGNQCVDLIMAYYQYLGVSRVSGHGYQYATNSLPSGWTRIQNTPTFVPEPGDIVVWNASIGGGYGHVGIFISGDTSSFVSIDQNWPKGTSCQKVTHNYNSVWGVVRPDFSASVPPSNPTISQSQYWYDRQDTIYLTGYADNTTKYIAVIDDAKGNRLVYETAPSNVFSISAETLINKSGYGDYWACMIMENSAGGVQSEWIKIPIADKAGYSKVYTSKPIYDIDDTISITVDTVCAKGQVIGIDKDGTGRVVTESCDSTFTISAYDLGVGTYSAYFSVYNGSGGVDTERVSFIIPERQNLGDEFCAKIENPSSSKFLTAVGDNVEGIDENCDKKQVWYFYRLSDNSYKIKNYYDWRPMDVDNYAASGAGTNVHLYNDQDVTAQRFYIYKVYDAYYIKPVCTDMMLDLSQTTYNLEVWGAGVDWSAQKFDIHKIDVADIGIHKYEESIVDDSESGKKYSVHTCTVCGDYYSEEIVTIYSSGDINNDKTVNMKDIVLLQQYLNNWDVDLDLNASDVNGDNSVNMKDIVLLQQYLNGWNVTLS